MAIARAEAGNVAIARAEVGAMGWVIAGLLLSGVGGGGAEAWARACGSGAMGWAIAWA